MTAGLRWGILGPGNIARVFADAVDGLDGHTVVATGSRDPARARVFHAERGYEGAMVGTYRDLVRCDAVDAVYVASPHPGHLEHAALAMRHGKAVLCEKPLCVNASEARWLCAIARQRRVPLLEAMWTRFLPATRQAADWLAAGRIGRPRRLSCSFGFETAFDPGSRLYAPELAGGSLLDIGCYTLSLLSLVFGKQLQPPALTSPADSRPASVRQAAGESDSLLGAELSEMEVEADLAPSGVDRHCRILLRFQDGAEARLESSICRATEPTAIIRGEIGEIRLPEFWRAQQAVLAPDGQDVKALDCPFRVNGYEYQALEMERLLREGSIESPFLPHAESVALLVLMDEVRRRIGVRYPFESSMGVTAGSHRGMTYRASPAFGRRRCPAAEGAVGDATDSRPPGRLPESDSAPEVHLPVEPRMAHLSRLVLGTMALDGGGRAGQDRADELLDAAFENGICAVDTGHVYGGGASERAVGSWLERRRLADDVFVLSKGCHPDAAGPRVNPDALAGDFAESLDRLRLETLDLYMLHRDDPEVPVDEIVGAMGAVVDSGRLRSWGCSNWTRSRLEAASASADANGLPGPVASSPHFSLAEQVNEPWPGCVSLTGAAAAEDRAWHRRTGMAIFAWSSLARGLFSGRVTRRGLAADPALVDDACRTAYVHPPNLARLERVALFAATVGASVPQVALAWVLAQDLPLHAIVGAATVTEVEGLVAATALSIDDAEAAWLHRGGRRPPSMARESLAARLERHAVRIGRRLPGPIKTPIKKLVGRA